MRGAYPPPPGVSEKCFLGMILKKSVKSPLFRRSYTPFIPPLYSTAYTMSFQVRVYRRLMRAITNYPQVWLFIQQQQLWSNYVQDVFFYRVGVACKMYDYTSISVLKKLQSCMYVMHIYRNFRNIYLLYPLIQIPFCGT